jgi:alpha-beta hydrolase superfamily lysophospholipase
MAQVEEAMHTSGEERVLGPGGLGIFVRWWQPASRARGAVVICHGVNSHSGYYLWAAEQLVADGLAVYALDLRGRGHSDGERFYLDRISDYVHDVHAVVGLAKSRNAGLPVFLLGHSAGGVVSCVYTLEHQAELAGLICESFAFQLPAPDFALAAVKGLSHLAPHAHVLRLKNEDFSRDPQVVDAMNRDPLIANEVQPTRTVAELARADERLRRSSST